MVVSAVYVSDDPMFEKSFLNSAITVMLCSLWHPPAAVQRFVARWHGVLLRRHAAAAPDVEWWARVQGDGYVRDEIAGTDAPADWAAWGRSVLGIADDEADVLDYLDNGAGIYRAASIIDGRMDACVFISPRPALPARSWLGGLFAKTALAETDRMAVLAGRPLDGAADHSPLVCSCFRVRRSSLDKAIRKNGLRTPAEVGAWLKAGTNCGSCLPEIRVLLAGVAPASRADAPPCAPPAAQPFAG